MINCTTIVFGPCHGILFTALLNKKWLYTRDLALQTSLPLHVVGAALAQMHEAKLIDYDPILIRFRINSLYLKKDRLKPDDNGTTL